MQLRILMNMINGANKAAFLKMHQVLKYVLNIKYLGLKIETNRNKMEQWDFMFFSNSNYEGDWVTKRCISEFILYDIHLPVYWRSKAQRSITLSSSEAE